MQRLGLIGLGLVGSALAERFLAAGFHVRGYDVAADKRAALQTLGGSPVAGPCDVLDSTNVCVLSLPNSQIACAVVADLAPHFSGGFVIDTTTGEPESSERMATLLGARGTKYLDATLVGSSRQIRGGEAIALVGGEQHAFETLAAVWPSLASQAFYLGPVGSGSRMKLVVNLVLGLNRAVLAEGLAFAQATGVDPARALEVLRAGAAYSRIMDTKGRKMLDRDFSVEARLSQHHKDVRLILAAAARAELELPLSSLHDLLLARAEKLGYGELDNSAVAALWSHTSPQGNR